MTKTLALALTLASPVLAHASPAPDQTPTTAWCAVVTWSENKMKDPNHAATWLFSKDVTLKEGGETEILRTERAVYTAHVMQHDERIAPELSTVYLEIREVGTDHVLASGFAAWPRQPSTGRLSGFNRLQIQTNAAEQVPGDEIDTQFLCDDKLLADRP